MAYGNWGARIYRNKEAQHHACDTTVARLLEGKPHYAIYLDHYVEEIEREDYAGWMYHGIAGDMEAGILLFLYKSYVAMVLNVETMQSDEEAVSIMSEHYDLDEPDRACTVTVNDVEIHVEHLRDPERVEFSFVGKDGSRWTGVSGYLLGEGHEEWC